MLASGVGTNLQALLDEPAVGPWIVLVVSDRAEAGALERARKAGVAAVFLDPDAHTGREAFDRAMLALLAEHEVEYLALAGFMRILGPVVVRPFAGRILNVHPAILPAFPGTHAVADALAWGVRLTGVTVHLVDEEVDHGPIVFQEAVLVLPDDDRGALEARIHEVEHRLFPAALRAMVGGRLKVDGRVVHVLPEGEA